MKLDPIHKIIAIIAGLIAIATATVNVATGLPFRSLLGLWVHEITSIQSTDTFKIETIETDSGTLLNPPGRFSYKFDIPLTAKGKTSLSEKEHLWAVLKDQYGGYYVQSPPVEVRNGEWLSYNIRPLGEIKEIIWLAVTEEGHGQFTKMVKSAHWSKFAQLPDNSRSVGFVLMR